jgi:hypothetical protein
VATPLGWYSDPTGRYLYRYWDGAAWTSQVSNGGAHSGVDPNLLPADVVTTPPAPGTAAPSPTTPAPRPAVQVTQASGSSVGTFVAVLVAIAAVAILLVVLFVNSGDDNGTTDTTTPPATTEAPAPTEAP